MTLTVLAPLGCDEVVRQLWPHLDGALPESERARIVAHLEACEGCRSHYDFAAAFLEAVRTSHAPDQFASLRSRVAAALRTEGSTGR